MITKDSIDKIIDTARVDEVVGDFVSLKKRGTNLIGLCPFHNEKTPSFYVSPAKGIYKCFGCGKAGGAVNFVMEHEHYSYPEALRYLAEKYNIEIEEEQKTQEQRIEQDEKESLYVLSSFAQKFYSKNLFDTEEGRAIGLSYFKERGFGDLTIEKFQLGYALNGWNSFTDEALKNDFRKELLVKTGLAVQKEDSNKTEERFYDRFRGRVIFPIHNITGRVIGFGARILKTEPNSPKYLNSPESEIYLKSKSLYGIFYAKKAIAQHDECFLVEGYTDVISMHQSGIENVVASSGTSLTQDQIRLISRYSRNITVLYDGDAAGIKASLRGIDMILEEGCNVRVVLFPDGEDPDSFSRKVSMSELRDYIKSNSQDFIRFKTNLLLAETKDDPFKKAGLVKDIVSSISKIPDAVVRISYIKTCSELMGFEEQVLVSELNRLIRKKFYGREEPPIAEEVVEIKVQEKPTDNKAFLVEQERELVRILLNYSEHEMVDIDPEDSTNQLSSKKKVKTFIVEHINYDKIEFEDPTLSKVYSRFSYLEEKNEKFDLKYYTNNDDDELKNLAIDLTTSSNQLSEWDTHHIFVPQEKDQLGKLVMIQLYRFQLRKVMVMLEENLNLIKENNWIDGGYTELQLKHNSLLDLRKTLTIYLGTVVVR